MTRGSSQGVWVGSPPGDCEICYTDLIKCGTFIDGVTDMGPWALMCPSCHKGHGRGLGTGKGQKYESKVINTISSFYTAWVKTEG